MNNRYRIWTGLFFTFGMMAAFAPARAQVAEEAADERLADETAPTQPGDPAVEAILATNPTTPAEMTRAAKILADLQRPDLAKAFLKKVLNAKLDQKQLAALQAQFGSLMFVQMGSRAGIAPEGKQLANLVLDAATRELRDPARLAGLVKQLQDPSADVRYQALDGLRRAGSAAVGPLVAVLADPGRAAEHTNVRAALVRLGDDAVDPLLGVLESSDPKLTVEAIRALADVNSPKAVVYLLVSFASEKSHAEVRAAAEAALSKLVGKTPDKQAAAKLLAKEAQQHFDRLQPLKADAEGRVEIWTWDVANKQPAAKSYPTEDAAVRLAARFAQAAYAIAPENEDLRRLHLTTMLEQAAYEAGLDKPLAMSEDSPAGKAAGFGTDAVEDVLEYGIASGHVAAAIAAARILGQKGTAEELLYQSSRTAPLVRAARHSDRRLRFAAIQAILQLGPNKPFAGSSHVPEALSYFAAATGQRRALVAGPRTAESQRVGGYLVALGYELDTATTGRQLIQLAIASSDCELVLVDAALEKPTVDLLLQQFRHDNRTATLPVGIFARSGQLDRAEHIARRDPLAEAFPRPHTQEAVRWQVDRVLALAGRQFVSQQERLEQAARALEWLTQLSAQDQKVFKVRRAEDAAMAVLYVPQLAPKAVALLSKLGTPQAQRALVDLASRWTQPLEVRKAAVEAFWENTAGHGILLTNREILLQYDRYNQSENLDQATQQVLASIIDCIEAPYKASQQAEKNEGEDGGKK